MKEYVYPGHNLPSKKSSKLLALVGDNKDVLEVGCAMGFQTRALKEQQSCKVVGIELNAHQASHAKPFCEDVIIGNIETLDLGMALGTKKFDVITFADVLEHLRDPVEALSKTKPLLNDSGYIVASIPNIVHSSVIFEMARGSFNYRTFGLLDDTHIRFFTKKTIYETFEKAGFLIVTVERNIVKPNESEFKTTPQSQEDQALLDYIAHMNPECDTYQFVVKAIPADNVGLLQAELISAQSQVQHLQNSLRTNQARINTLESHMEWLRNKPLRRIATKFNALLGRK